MFSWNQCSSGTFYSIFNNKKSVFQHGGVELLFEGNLRSITEHYRINLVLRYFRWVNYVFCINNTHNNKSQSGKYRNI